MYVDKTNKILDNNESVKICVWKRKTTENTQRECVRWRDRESRTQFQNYIKTLYIQRAHQRYLYKSTRD